ncbi:hypothetical protein ABMA28_007819 [Loxostege sticticalis]|uniref:DUF4789 domain-containing protein n=1 Tax=Loxostege sticticalis TaxID=481309 RepID=A0ABD0SIW0_LOXSC
MMKYKISVFVGYLLLAVTIAQNNDTKNSIGFPEIEEDLPSKNKDNRQPVYMPSTCAVNELYYPGDQKDDWICDCRPAYIYHPESDACWGAYQRGPCAFGEYLILPKDSVIPVCMKNPCNADRYVYWGGRCERLGSITACADLYPVVAAVGVNATTLEIQCVRLNLESRFGEGRPVLQPVDFNKCKPGSKLSVTGKCVK